VSFIVDPFPPEQYPSGRGYLYMYSAKGAQTASRNRRYL
jgi:hypothetical protein